LNGANPVLMNLAESRPFTRVCHTGHQLVKHGSGRLFEESFKFLNASNLVTK